MVFADRSLCGPPVLLIEPNFTNTFKLTFGLREIHSDKKLFATTSSPVGCFETGQTVYFTSVVPTGAVILSGVKGLLEVPMSNGCEEDDSNRLEVTIKP